MGIVQEPTSYLDSINSGMVLKLIINISPYEDYFSIRYCFGQ